MVSTYAHASDRQHRQSTASDESSEQTNLHFLQDIARLRNEPVRLLGLRQHARHLRALELHKDLPRT